ncbi:efflux RND transporter periplasmic adaptor subunit [Paraglaciecola aestuariivivens]
MNKLHKRWIPAIIILCSVGIVLYVTSNPPKTERRSAGAGTQVMVEVSEIVPRRYQVMLDSFGVVQPRTQSVLVAQVSGQIIKVSEQFRDGGFFEKGEPLVWLDDRDFKAESLIAQANVSSAQQALLEEQAKAEQALIDWKRLGNGAKPNSLVLREPQLAAAQASLLSAQAQKQKADLALERATIRAPYAGRILKTQANLGQVVSSNASLASIYAIDNVEVRLPINNSDLALIDLPVEYRDQQNSAVNAKVYLYSDLVGEQKWLAKLVRTEGAIDASTQQLYAVAQIEDPYSRNNSDSVPVKIGQYVNARLEGKTLDNAIVIPNSAIYQGSYVYTVSNNTLLRQDINIRWQNNSEAIISQGLQAGDTLVLTPMGQVSSGTRVQIAEPKDTSNQIQIGSMQKPGQRDRSKDADKPRPAKGKASQSTSNTRPNS